MARGVHPGEGRSRRRAVLLEHRVRSCIRLNAAPRAATERMQDLTPGSQRATGAATTPFGAAHTASPPTVTPISPTNAGTSRRRQAPPACAAGGTRRRWPVYDVSVPLGTRPGSRVVRHQARVRRRAVRCSRSQVEGDEGAVLLAKDDRAFAVCGGGSLLIRSTLRPVSNVQSVFPLARSKPSSTTAVSFEITRSEFRRLRHRAGRAQPDADRRGATRRRSSVPGAAASPRRAAASTRTTCRRPSTRPCRRGSRSRRSSSGRDRTRACRPSRRRGSSRRCRRTARPGRRARSAQPQSVVAPGRSKISASGLRHATAASRVATRRSGFRRRRRRGRRRRRVRPLRGERDRLEGLRRVKAQAGEHSSGRDADASASSGQSSGHDGTTPASSPRAPCRARVERGERARLPLFAR